MWRNSLPYISRYTRTGAPRFYSRNSEHIAHAKPSWVPFFNAKYGNFVQDPPRIENQYIGNAFMQNYLQVHLPSELFAEVEKDLRQFGERVATDIHQLGIECELNKPYLRNGNAWGSGTNQLMVCDAWNKQKDIAAEEGIISIGYERKKYDRWARIYQFAKLYLYAPSSGLYSCPLAMTDGAARTFEQLNLLQNPVFLNAYNRLTSRDPKEFWTSGQWMTEKGGGSDVAKGTETVAIPFDSKTHKLYGYKWFSSANDANIALALARVSDDEGNVVQGSDGLTLFYIPVKEDNDSIDPNIQLVRLKDKLGTRQLPTAELLLDGVHGMKISQEGRGVSSISPMLHVTRIHNSVACASYLQRMYSIARDYAHRRKAFGKLLIDNHLHAQTLARIDLISKASFLFSFEIVKLLGLLETNAATEDEKKIFRILNPLVKLYNAKVAVPAVSEGLECIGGQGAMEDTGIPHLYRDVQIFAIWEGTTSVLAMDVLRAIMKTSGDNLYSFRNVVKDKLDPVFKNDNLKDCAVKVVTQLDEMLMTVKKQPMILESGARDFAFSLCNLFISTLMLEHAINVKGNSHTDLLAKRFTLTQDLVPFMTNFKLDQYSSANNQANYDLVVENYRK